LLVALAALALKLFAPFPRLVSRPGVTRSDYLYKIARITGCSEYEVFRKSAEQWPVGPRTVDRDFKRYLIDQQIPHYVNDFIRRHREQIDTMRLPPV
ncbi:MAG: hypothetical protein QNI97_12890, partial [Desulfobacterales bacterium]|nr:hypothetical protein [Desulfobacterales bacterium]MDJ0989027.1 hypothetical protein [Desulfobacterales bacterium]